MEFGLENNHLIILKSILNKYIPIGKVIVYGSRAKGNFTPRSDLDLVISNTPHTDLKLISIVKEAIEQSNFPYICDIQYLANIKNSHLLDHIDRVGKTLYEKGE